MKILQILPGLLIITIFALVVINSFIKECKKKKVQKDLIYLKFLIQESTKDKFSKKHIENTIFDYMDKPEYKCDLFDRCVKLFNEKFK